MKRIWFKGLDKLGPSTVRSHYKNDKLKFEGEYLNGVKKGKWTEYNSDGKLIFEGEYINGKRWFGIRKEYISDDKC